MLLLSAADFRLKVFAFVSCFIGRPSVAVTSCGTGPRLSAGSLPLSSIVLMLTFMLLLVGHVCEKVE